MPFLRVVLAAGLLVALSACGGDDDEDAETAPAPPPVVEAPSEPPPAATPAAEATIEPEPAARPEGYISKADLGDKWPLTTEDGVLRCQGSDGYGAATIRTAGKVYALNGVAKQQEAGVDIEPIWRDDPDLDGLKISLVH